MSKKQNKKIDLAQQSQGFSTNPFAQLAPLKDALPDAPELPQAPQDTTQEPALPLAHIKLITLRCEHKGRGGKTVTLIQGVERVEPELLQNIASELSKKLGCRAQPDETKDGPCLLVQGDQRQRLPDLLRAYGAKTIKTL